METQAASRTNRRQFIFSNARIDAPAGWRSIGLGIGFFLYHCPLLNVVTAVDSSGQRWGLLGHAFEIATDHDDPIAGIARSPTQDVPKLVATWSGRWLLLCPSALITDAGALLGAYTLENDKGVIISGSLALLSQLTGVPVRDSRIIGWYGFNWFPGPLCKLDSVRRLLPDQIYNPQSRCIKFFDRLPALSHVNLNDAADELICGLTRVFRAMSRQGNAKPLFLALTAGLDSRTNFSVLQASDVPFTTLTLQHPRISRADATLPATISSTYHITHRYVASDKLLRDKLDEYDAHTYGCVVDGDRYFYARGNYESFGPQGWIIRSGCWELGRKYFHTKLRGLTLEELLDRPDRLMLRFRTFLGTKASADSLREWVRWRLDHPVGIPWQDLFYRDQRLGGWLSSIEQSLDLIDLVSIHPVNCDRFYCLMLGSEGVYGSQTAALQHEIIARCAAGLKSVPINPPLDGRYFATKNIFLKTAAIAGGEFKNLLKLLTPS